MTTKKQHPGTIPLTPDWQEAFKAFTLKPNFVLALSRPMLEFLCACADDVQWDRATYGMRTVHQPDNWFATSRSLIKRGLIVDARGTPAWSAKHSKQLNCQFLSHYALTPAGKAVVKLLKVTGLYIEHDTALQKKSKA